MARATPAARSVALTNATCTGGDWAAKATPFRSEGATMAAPRVVEAFRKNCLRSISEAPALSIEYLLGRAAEDGRKRMRTCYYFFLMTGASMAYALAPSRTTTPLRWARGFKSWSDFRRVIC